VGDASDSDPINVLSEDRCWELLAGERVGRLVVVFGDRAEIYPVNYVTKDRKIFFRSSEGNKLLELTVHPIAAFEVDHIGDDDAWSVVVHGRARVVRTLDETTAIDALGLTPWVPDAKYNYVEVTASEVSGRQFPLIAR